jgi:PKD repeat protein
MKKILLVVLVLISILSACSSSDSENIISCVFEGANFNLSSNVSAANSKEVNFTLTYTGDETLDNSIVWDFGDGTTGTFSGNSVSHTYSTTGTFRVVAKPTLRNGDAFCSITKDREITIN